MKPTKIYEARSTIRMFNADCMEFMQDCDMYDLSIVDPPYGIGEDKTKRPSRGKSKTKAHISKSWDDSVCDEKYFNTLIEYSKNQVIWGANHFIENINKNSSCWLVWNKKTAGNTADCELAWTSFKTAVRRFDFLWEGFWQEDMKNKQRRIHPTEKPVNLYKWILKNYANEGDTILDTHGGSMSIAIACWDLGFDLDIIELDEDYFNDAVKRFEQHISQTQLF